MSQLKQLAKCLPKLTELGTKITESQSNAEAESKFFSIFSMFPGVNQLSVFLPDFKRFLREFKTHASEFYARFKNQFDDGEIEIIDGTRGDKISMSSDRM